MAKEYNYKIEFPEKIKKHVQNRYQRNIEKEKWIESVLDDLGHINGQKRYPVDSMHFGSTRAGGTACEAIAVYNVLNDIGKNVMLSDIILLDEAYGYMFAFGYFGTKINKIGHLLRRFHVRYKVVPVKEFVKKARNNDYEDGQLFIATIKNRADMLISPLHTFELVYKDKKWTVFNRFNESNGETVYIDVESVLINGKEIGSFFYIYEIII